MKILINVPPLELTGGVSGHFRGLKDHWGLNIKYNVNYRTLTNRNGRLLIPYNIIRYTMNLMSFNPDLTVLNVSLKKGFLSKVYYYYFAKIFNTKVIVFIHGWDTEGEDYFKKKHILNIFNNCESIIVLSQEFKNKLITAGIIVPIYISTTKVSNEMVSKFRIEQRAGRINNFLFVSRIVKEKGIFIALDTFNKLKKDFPNITFTIVGDGPEENEVKEYIKKNNIKDVEVVGKLFGELLIDKFEQADFFFLISHHGEGLPAALIEAMAFGLPVATRPMGGTADFFQDDEMGILSESLDSDYYYNRILPLMKDEKKVKKISLLNYDYAQKNFLAFSVAKNLEMIFQKAL